MNTILNCLVQQHDWRILPFALLVSIFSLVVALSLFDRARNVARRSRRVYLVAAPLVAGLGVWSTHFIAMKAYDIGAPVRYDIGDTAVSLAVVVVAFYVAMHLALAEAGRVSRVVAALTCGLGVAAMHFMGMAGLRLSGATLSWNAPLVVVAVIGGMLLVSAIAVLPWRAGAKRVIVATILGALGVCWLHFVAMSAVIVTPTPGVLLPVAAAAETTLTLWIGASVGLLAIIAAFLTGMVWWSRHSALGQLREAIEAMPDGLGFYDADDRLAIWNQRYADVNPEVAAVLKVGVSFREILEAGLKAGIYPCAEGREQAWIAERMANRRRPQGAMEQNVGDRWLRVQDRRTAEKGTVTVCSDITDLKRDAQALAEARDAADAANRAKSQFLANMSHEIRTPLNGVIGVAQALARTDLDAQQREMLDLIHSSSRTLQTLLSDILDLARVESGRLELGDEPYDLARAVEEAAQLYAAAARDKGLQFFVEVAPEARIWMHGDAVRLKQILTNLVSNAVKFTGAGFVSLTVDAGPQGLRFVVQDTGIGFDAETRDRLFSRFEQADGDITRRFGGSGLGLAISRELAAMMGGGLGCESEPGGGAAFILTLPQRPAQAPAAPTPTLVASEASAFTEQTRRLRILVADDHPTNRRVVELILDQEAVDLVSVEDGAQAVEACRAAPFDLVLMDMQMPVMDGLTATREIRLHEVAMGAPRTPIVMLTANALPEHIAAGIEAGADRHLAKPFSVEALLAMVQELTTDAPQAAVQAA
ncbi:MAG: response regulator [Candidatus Brevundimonas phytovorans]|nr:ATP-binding protein [Brevundimonas sp.]WEK58534.1 MAG: response regulator [Brevundimonas sp.]